MEMCVEVRMDMFVGSSILASSGSDLSNVQSIFTFRSCRGSLRCLWTRQLPQLMSSPVLPRRSIRASLRFQRPSTSRSSTPTVRHAVPLTPSASLEGRTVVQMPAEFAGSDTYLHPEYRWHHGFILTALNNTLFPRIKINFLSTVEECELLYQDPCFLGVL